MSELEPSELTIETLLACDRDEVEATFNNIEAMLAWLNDEDGGPRV